MSDFGNWTRRHFLATTGLAVGAAAMGRFDRVEAFAATVTSPHGDLVALRQDILDSAVSVGLHRARVFTKVFQETEDKPWVLRKALALREYFKTVPL
ncbi:MAG: twin-arginine translocation signal domain-containing protein, partial [Planctomycetes bacterium]|nr:twin-arginine translocation signal domain-containing protein [Planctomycetota bacterium]